MLPRDLHPRHQYSSVHGPQSPAGASLWIAKLLSPSTCTNATMIATPEFDWEKSDSLSGKEAERGEIVWERKTGGGSSEDGVGVSSFIVVVVDVMCRAVVLRCFW